MPALLWCSLMLGLMFVCYGTTKIEPLLKKKREYIKTRSPSFCDRILVSTHQSAIHLKSLAYDSITNGIIQMSDHDLVYQVIEVSDSDPFREPMTKKLLIITWNFGKAFIITKSTYNHYYYFELMNHLKESLNRHQISLMHDIDVIFFSFQEAVSASFEMLIDEIQRRINGMYHVQTVESGDSVDINTCCGNKQIGYKVYGLLFVKKSNDISYKVLGKSRKLNIARPALVFVSKSAAFTSSIRFGDSLSIIFIATHFPVDTKKTEHEDFGVKQRIKALKEVYDVVGGDRNIMLVLSGDLNFRQNVSFSNNPDGRFIEEKDQLSCVLNEEGRWKELEKPTFPASCKRVYELPIL